MLKLLLRQLSLIASAAVFCGILANTSFAALPSIKVGVQNSSSPYSLPVKPEAPQLKFSISASDTSVPVIGTNSENPSFFSTIWNSPKVLQLASVILVIGILASAAWRYVHMSSHNRELRRAQAKLMSLNETLDAHVHERTQQLTQEIEGRKRSQKIVETFFNQSQTLNLVIDSDARIVRINKAWESVLGFSRSKLKSKPLVDFVVAEDHDITNELLETLRQGGKVDGIENRWNCADGSVATLRWSARPDTKNQLFYGSAQDITSQKKAEDALRLSASVFTATDEGIMITDPSGMIVDVNKAFSEITGYSREDVLGQSASILSSGDQDPEFYKALWQSLFDTGSWRGEIWNKAKDGRIYPEMLTISTAYDENGYATNYIGLFSDITGRKERESELIQLAQYDRLTGLPNRALLSDRLGQAMARSRRRQLNTAVAFIDLDGFKAVNDTNGHAAGDKLLVEISRRLKSHLREEDTLARIGGDEFVALITDLPDPKDCIGTLDRIKNTAAEPIDIGDGTASVTASIGVTFYPQEGDIGAEQLEHQADQAMYQAKMAGRNRYRFFDPELVRVSA
ncbi:MAG: diguanylate cyclase [Roseibium sp.]